MNFNTLFTVVLYVFCLNNIFKISKRQVIKSTQHKNYKVYVISDGRAAIHDQSYLRNMEI